MSVCAEDSTATAASKCAELRSESDKSASTTSRTLSATLGQDEPLINDGLLIIVELSTGGGKLKHAEPQGAKSTPAQANECNKTEDLVYVRSTAVDKKSERAKLFVDGVAPS